MLKDTLLKGWKTCPVFKCIHSYFKMSFCTNLNSLIICMLHWYTHYNKERTVLNALASNLNFHESSFAFHIPDNLVCINVFTVMFKIMHICGSHLVQIAQWHDSGVIHVISVTQKFVDTFVQSFTHLHSCSCFCNRGLWISTSKTGTALTAGPKMKTSLLRS